jgi:tRNA dimethylallyltransferase
MSGLIIFIVGPTAAGKTEVAAALSGKLSLAIVSCDSMQVYKEMNIISCKPSLELRRRVPHYLVDVVSAEVDYSVADYQREARLVIDRILNDGRRAPCIVGGSGLYMSVLLDGLFSEGPRDAKLREVLKSQAESFGNEYLYARLKKVDPQAAKKIHPNDLRRIIRALEVFELTCRPISRLQKERSGLWGHFKINIFCLNRPREELYARINGRVEKMFKAGLIEEVKKLLKLRLSKTAAAIIGIKEIKGYLDGDYDLVEARRLMQQNSRRYAKRQLTWFKKDKRLQWIEIKEGESPQAITNQIVKLLNC